jgi:8-hydroxy-5-deazaflavin:NADPH oxidoreductase
MRIGIIGAGNVGTGIGKRLAAAHDVMVSFARTPDKVEAAAAAIGNGARAGTPAEAARYGEVVIVATPWPVTLDAVRSIADALAGKVLWDATNPLKPDMSGLEIGTTTSGGEQVAAAAPDARVVKPVPPFAEVLHAGSTRIAGRRPGVFVAGDDDAARAVVLGLIAEIDAEGVDAGPLTLARYTEPLGMLLVQLAYAQGFGARIGTALLKEA